MFLLYSKVFFAYSASTTGKGVNTHRWLCAEKDDVSYTASESTFHSTDLSTVRNHKTIQSFISVRYSSCICLLLFVSILFPLDLAIIWEIDVAV